MWSLASGECLRCLSGHARPVISAVFSPDDEQVLTASQDRTAGVWSAASGECLRTLSGHTHGVRRAVFSPDGPTHPHSFLRLHDAGVVRCFGGVPVHNAVFSPGGQQVVTTSWDMAKVRSAATGECLRTLEGHMDTVSSAVFSPDGQPGI